ncbi:MAG: DUF1254 domain-containing protein [Acidimicrobiales bacterium]
MDIEQQWSALRDAIDFAVSRVVDDDEPLNEREAADGHQYVLRVLRAVSESALMTVDPRRPGFLPMLDSVRHLGAAGPDIDYDVAILVPGGTYCISGTRGGASYVGIAVYAGAGAGGATAIVDSVDVDDLVADDGTFVHEVHHPDAVRVIVRQYFHDRTTQEPGSWTIERTDEPAGRIGGEDGDGGAGSAALLPTSASVAARVANAARSVRWNLQLNQLWTPERRAQSNAFVRQTSDDIVAAVPNPDVLYAFSWWRITEGEALVIDVDPPDSRYWAVQLCDRWFQCFPDRRSNLNDRQLVPEPDGSVRIVVADGYPGHPNWLDTSGHRVGTIFFRWLHADPDHLPTCRVVAHDDVAGLAPGA